MQTEKEIIAKFKRNQGFLIIENLRESINRYVLKKMLVDEKITRLKRGVYVLNNHENYDERVLISRMYPDAVFCLFSAWAYYELSTSLPVSHCITLGRNTKISVPVFPPISVYYWSDIAYRLGVTEVSIN